MARGELRKLKMVRSGFFLCLVLFHGLLFQRLTYIDGALHEFN